MSNAEPGNVLIAGAGPAGLTAAYELCRRGAAPTVFEKDPIVGGIARTEEFQGYRFDIGGHRFFTKLPEVSRLWDEVLGDKFLRVPRLSRIYYNRRFFFYPLKLGNVIHGLGLWNSFLIFLSFLQAKVSPYPEEKNLEQWVSNRFGKRLYRTFFKTYTEKVWGMPCTSIRAEWAAQRIKGLSLRTVVQNALFGDRHGKIKSLIEEFLYPQRGPGMMWEAFQDSIHRSGGRVLVRHPVSGILRTGDRIDAFVVDGPDGRRQTIVGDHFLSSAPVAEVIAQLDPSPPEEVLRAAAGLKYRDFLTVCLIIHHPDLFPDNWIYIHSPEVRMGRLQNFKNWSRHMVADTGKTSLGVEYFVNENDDLWSMPDRDLIALASAELRQIGLTRGASIEAGAVFRQKKAYPVYDETYRERLEVIERFLRGIRNLQMIGRNGLHKYNNQDHSMMTGRLAVENLYGARHDLWQYNSDQEYQEEAGAR
jgi:protoporphyrinogen oxidase